MGVKTVWWGNSVTECDKNLVDCVRIGDADTPNDNPEHV